MIQNLNENQTKAVLHFNGAALVLAPAGAGKTRVVIARAMNLVKNHSILPYRIMILTFTNKSAKELKECVTHYTGELGNGIVAGTFHSVFIRFLKKHAAAIGFESNLTVLDHDDQTRFVKDYLKKNGLDKMCYDAKMIISFVSAMKSEGITPAMFEVAKDGNIESLSIRQLDKAKRYFSNSLCELPTIYKDYCNLCKKQNSMDFDDVLKYFNILLNHSNILTEIQNQFHYFMVDEFQDTNFIQYEILQKLASANNNLFVVGDDAQSIYSFRGAIIENILNFHSKFNATLYKLDTNYRSTGNIVNAAQSLIQHNLEQIPKTVTTPNPKGNKIQSLSFWTEKDEANFLLKMIENMRLRGGYYKDCAILYRTNAQGREPQMQLFRAGIPFKVYGDISFYQRKEIKDLIAYMKVVVNPFDTISLKRIIDYPKRGIGDAMVAKLEKLASNGVLWDVVKHLSFGVSIDYIIDSSKINNAYDVATLILKRFGLIKDLQQIKDQVESIEKIENIGNFVASIKQFCTENPENCNVSDFMESIELIADNDTANVSDNHVSLMSVHRSKGLEFKNVFVIGLQENTFPFFYAIEEGNVSEERRLFYVAMTRARKELFLCRSLTYAKFGKIEAAEPSRFLSEIDKRYLEF